MADDAKTHKEIERLRGEVDSLAGELDKALGDAVYVPMSANEQEVYDGKRGKLARLKQRLAQLIRGQKANAAQQKS